ncbi:MAG: hypothetical protein ACLPY5_05595 [Candidatus Bathyarchaeia archaeon]
MLGLILASWNIKMPRHPKPTASSGTILGIPIIVLIVVGSVVVLLLPLSPVLTVTLQVSPSSNQPVTILAQSYSKTSLLSSSSLPKGSITFLPIGAQSGQIVVSVGISYGGQVLSNATQSGLGQGAYQFQVIYWPRYEQSGVFYSIEIQVFSGNTLLYTILTGLLPS